MVALAFPVLGKNLKRIIKIIAYHTNLVPRAFISTDQQKGEARAMRT